MTVNCRSIDWICNELHKLDPSHNQADNRYIVNNILNRGVSLEFLSFAVEYGIQTGILHHPPGLYYLVHDDEVLRAYQKAHFKGETVDDIDRNYDYHPPKKRSILDVVG